MCMPCYVRLISPYGGERRELGLSEAPDPRESPQKSLCGGWDLAESVPGRPEPATSR